MSNEEAPKGQKIEFTQEEADLAASQEESERLMAENQHLKNRVVMLRALVNRLQKEAAEKVSSEEATPATE